jgi:arsenate reductase
VSVKIWHNPRCSKSRAALALLREKGIEPEVRLYLEDSPDAAELGAVLALLGMEPSALIRKGEAVYKEAGLGNASDEAAVLLAMVAHPKLIERPIVIANGKARVGRPPEAVLDIL